MESRFRKKPLLIGGERKEQGLRLINYIIIDLFVNEVKAVLRKYAKKLPLKTSSALKRSLRRFN